MRKLTKEFGKHYLVEFINCNPEKIKFVRKLKKPFLKAVAESKTKILKYTFYQFKPFGVSGVVLIAESHFALHTWPEENYSALDILTCGKMYPEITIKELKNFFEAKKTKVRIFSRGF